MKEERNLLIVVSIFLYFRQTSYFYSDILVQRVVHKVDIPLIAGSIPGQCTFQLKNREKSEKTVKNRRWSNMYSRRENRRNRRSKTAKPSFWDTLILTRCSEVNNVSSSAELTQVV
ncbi:Hypothetical_protein [Hexamita inflata]|uniref:Hypothetical_protein n=1 Tax=Hexamita inflata TaxID=28002 RepID=A0AA86UFM9_9EUKA|nr:Hypothetical protein HINF_LOCUS41609 [Hexamita inflata]